MWCRLAFKSGVMYIYISSIHVFGSVSVFVHVQRTVTVRMKLVMMHTCVAVVSLIMNAASNDLALNGLI